MLDNRIIKSYFCRYGDIRHTGIRQRPFIDTEVKEIKIAFDKRSNRVKRSCFKKFMGRIKQQELEEAGQVYIKHNAVFISADT